MLVLVLPFGVMIQSVIIVFVVLCISDLNIKIIRNVEFLLLLSFSIKLSALSSHNIIC